MCNVAIISAHTSPLALPGTRDSGGMNVYIRELSKELGLRANEIDIFTRRTDSSLPEIIETSEHSRVIHIEAGPPEVDKNSLRYYLPHFLRGVRVFQMSHGLSYDLIHSHYWLSGWVGQALKLHWNVPHVVMFHTLGEAKNRAYFNGDEPPYRIEAERQIARNADRIICASEGEAQLLADLYGVESARVSVVPCGVDLEQFRPMDKEIARAALGLANEPPLILFVGRIEPLKGIDILLRAVARLSFDCRLLVVGGDRRDTQRKRFLKVLVEELGIEDRVTFIDAVKHSDLPLFYNAAEICVVPSYYESFGLVALEAMACGVPVIASNVGGLPETVRNGESGFLISSGGPEGFAEKLSLLLADPGLRLDLGLRARLVAEQYQWTNVATGVQRVYHDLVTRYKGMTAHGLAGPPAGRASGL